MKKLVGLILGVGIFYVIYNFISMGCITKTQRPVHMIVNYILATYSYTEDKGVLLLGNRYFYLINGEGAKEGLKQSKENAETLRQLIGKEGVFIKDYTFLIDGDAKGSHVSFSLDIIIDPEKISPVLFDWAKSRTREVIHADNTTTEAIFYDDRQNRYQGNLLLSGKIYPKENEILESAVKLQESFELRVSDLGVDSALESLPQQDYPSSNQSYVLDAHIMEQEL